MGITFSPADDLRDWSQQLNYAAHLLCDADRAVALAYGAAKSVDQEKATRQSFLIGPDGDILRVYRDIDARRHPGDVLVDLAR